MIRFCELVSRERRLDLLRSGSALWESFSARWSTQQQPSKHVLNEVGSQNEHPLCCQREQGQPARQPNLRVSSNCAQAAMVEIRKHAASSLAGRLSGKKLQNAQSTSKRILVLCAYFQLYRMILEGNPPITIRNKTNHIDIAMSGSS